MDPYCGLAFFLREEQIISAVFSLLYLYLPLKTTVKCDHTETLLIGK